MTLWRFKVAKQNLLDEDLVCPKPTTHGLANISEDMCMAAKTARTTCNEKFDTGDVQSSDQVTATLKTHLPSLTSIDRTFDVEDSIMRAVTGTMAERRLIEAMRDCMPTMENGREPAAALQKIAELSTKPVFKYSTRSVQGKLITIQKALGRIVDGRAPDMTDICKDPDLRDVASLFQFFVRVHHAHPSGSGPGKTIAGRQALAHLYHSIKSKIDDPAVKRSTLGPLKIYGYLLPDDLIGGARALIAEVENQDSKKVGAPPIKSKKRKAASSNAAGDGDDEAADNAVAKAMVLFS